MQKINMVRCPNGHLYNPVKDNACPYCSPASQSKNRTIDGDQVTVASGEVAGNACSLGAYEETVGDIGVTVAGGQTPGGGVIDHTVAATPDKADAWATQAVLHEGQRGMRRQPAVGWLVCIKGFSRGEDFRLHSDNNSIGRSEGDVILSGDNTISKEKMAFVTFDEKTNVFLLSAGAGRNVVRLNNALVPIGQSREIHAYDRIEMGETVLLFLPLCGEEFDWQDTALGTPD